MSIFDKMSQDTATDESTLSASQNVAETQTDGASFTSRALKDAVQELLKFGLLDSAQKPNLYRTISSYPEQIADILEPLDLAMVVDDVRGLALLKTVKDSADADEWSHPLVRRQRLNLEHSLLIAILRQHFVAHESETGVGDSSALVPIDDLLADINSYLGELGSDAKEQKRLRNLLDNLKGYGLVSEVDAQDCITIRPLIVHVANPENLKGLLAAFIQHASEGAADLQGEV